MPGNFFHDEISWWWETNGGLWKGLTLARSDAMSAGLQFILNKMHEFLEKRNNKVDCFYVQSLRQGL